MDETTSSVAVGNATDGPPLNLMPFRRHGKSRKAKLRKTHGDWKTLTVPVHPWKRADAESAYEIANAHVGCEAMDFFDGKLVEASVEAAHRAMLSVRPNWTWEEMRVVFERSLSLFEDWKQRTILKLAQDAVCFLNENIEIVVRELVTLTEGMDYDFSANVAPMVKMDANTLYFNPNYEILGEAFGEATDGISANVLQGLFTMFGSRKLESSEFEEPFTAVDKIVDHLKATL